jgi:purine nucleoside permease
LHSPWLAGIIFFMGGEIKIVQVAMYEPSGLEEGELGALLRGGGFRPAEGPAERCGLEGRLFERGDGVLVLHAGVGTPNTAVTITSLGFAAGYDLSKAYWIISGIAGANPHTCPLGGVVWTDWAVDGDLSFELDVRDIPPDWPTGILPLGATEPYGPGMADTESLEPRFEVTRLSEQLCRWAHRTSCAIDLVDSEEMAACRARYADYLGGSRGPEVLVGGNLTTTRFWHGEYHNTWASRWVGHWSGGEGRFFTSGMEDTGTLHALRHLARLEMVDFQRILLLRSASNFTFPPPGVTVMDNLFGDRETGASFPGLRPALENSRRAVTAVTAELLGDWDRWREAEWG